MAPAKVALPIGTLYYAEHTIYKAEKALIAAKFNGLTIKKQKFDADKDPKKPEFVAHNPTGKVPYMETDMGCIFTSNAIARYVARCREDTDLCGRCFDDEGQVDTWLDFCSQELEVPLMAWVYPVLGLAEDVPKATAAAQEDVKKALVHLEGRLKESAFLVGDYVSLADIAIVCALREGFSRVFDPAFRKPYPKACAWFQTCCALDHFKSVLGEVQLCAKAEQPKPVASFSPPARAAKEESKPKAENGKKQKEQAAAAPTSASAAAPAASGGSAAELEAKVKKIGDDIRVLKEKLKAEGLSGKKINDHEGVKAKVTELQALKVALEAAPPAAASAAPAAQAAAPAAPAATGGDIDVQIKAVGDEIRMLKEKLKAEGLSGKKVNEHGEVKKLVDQLSALKAAAPQGEAVKAAAPKEAASKKEAAPKKEAKAQEPKKSKEENEEAKEPSPEELEKMRKDRLKKSIKEGGKRGVEIEGAADMGGLQFFCTSVDCPEGDLDILTECLKAMNQKCEPGEEERKGCSGHVGKMIFSAGVDQLAVAAYVPSEKQAEVSSEEWLKAVLANFGGVVLSSTKEMSTGVVKTNSDKNVFPLKIREPMLLEANNFLRKRGLFPEDDGDSDEMVFGDDDFPSM